MSWWALRVVAVGVGIALLPTATTSASWTDSEHVRAPRSTAATIAPDLACVPGVGGARIEWPGVTSPTAVTYTARVVGRGPLDPVAGEKVYYLPLNSLLDSVVSKSYVVEVTASLPSTSWTATSSVTVKTVLAGTLVSC